MINNARVSFDGFWYYVTSKAAEVIVIVRDSTEYSIANKYRTIADLTDLLVAYYTLKSKRRNFYL